MIHRLALFMGGTGAAGVLAVALALGGFGSPLPNTADGFVPVANDALGGGQRPAAAPTDQPTMTTSFGGGAPQDAPKKVVDTVYVLPAPVVHHSGRPANDANQPDDQPRDPVDDNNGGNNNGDDNGGDQAGDDQAGEDDHSNNGDHSDDGGGDDGGHEPGDD